MKNVNPQENRKLRPGEVIEEKKVKAFAEVTCMLLDIIAVKILIMNISTINAFASGAVHTHFFVFSFIFTENN